MFARIMPSRKLILLIGNEIIEGVMFKKWAVKLNINLGTSSIKTSTNVPGRPEWIHHLIHCTQEFTS